MNSEVEITYLPVLGKPESIRTAKQGGRKTLESLINVTTGKVDTQKTYGRSGIKRILDARILAYRIVRFKDSTASQINLCRNFIKEIEIEDLDHSNMPERALVLGNKVISINRFLFNRYKEFRKI